MIKKVLLVDDNDSERNRIKNIVKKACDLRKIDLDLVELKTLEDSEREFYSNKPFDLVMTDMLYPKSKSDSSKETTEGFPNGSILAAKVLREDVNSLVLCFSAEEHFLKKQPVGSYGVLRDNIESFIEAWLNNDL